MTADDAQAALEAARRLSPPAAVLLAVCVAWSYVGALALLPQRLRQLPRDHPDHIRGRVVAVLIVSLLAPLPVLVLLGHGGAGMAAWDPAVPRLLTADASALALLGLAPACNGLGSVLWPLAVTMLLFAGPLLELVLDAWDEAAREAGEGGEEKGGGAGVGGVGAGKGPSSALAALPSVVARRASAALEAALTLQRMRDLVVAPVTEEWVFRACVLPLLLSPHLAGMGAGSALLLAPALFGVAHFHHFLELRKGGKSVPVALLTVAVQFVYTSVFGAMSTYFYMATWSALSICLPHAFCNWMGVPGFWFLRGGDAGSTARRAAVGLAYAGGIVAFVWASRAAAADGAWLSVCGRG